MHRETLDLELLKVTRPRCRPETLPELGDTVTRADILVHPGHDFLASVGCINLCTSLPDAHEEITYVSSRKRVITVIENLKTFLGKDFPKTNGLAIPRAFVVIDGEP